MRQLLRRLFLDNLALKVLSLSLAVTLFVLVKGERDAQTGGFVKVIYSYPADRVLMTDPPDRVRLSVRGPWSRINRFDEHELDPIRVDLGTAASGEFKFQDDMVKLPQGLRVASFNPVSVRLEFEPRVTRSVPVTPTLEGTPAPGYRIEGTDVDPTAVSLTGAQSLLDSLSHLGTELVRVQGAHGTVVRAVELAQLPRHVELVDDSRVRVTVRIVPEMGEIMVPRVPVAAVGGPPPARIEPPAVDVIVRGPRVALDALSSDTVAASVDVREMNERPQGSYLRPITIGGLGKGLTAQARPASVRVTLARRPH
ncbi:MAG TPA: CdaR family protein [Polyangia bacterium]